MIVDIDHMSEKSTRETLEFFTPLDYPVVSGHATFRELSPRRHLEHEDEPRDQVTSELVNGGRRIRRETWERAHHSMWPHESEKTVSVLSALSTLRGMIAPITGGLADTRAHGHQVANNSAGSSKTWAQEFLYARAHMGNRGIALGTDAVALLAQPGARFGTQASWGLHEEERSGFMRRQQANRQARGVTYDSHIIDYRSHRFSHTDVYDAEEREIWEATAIVKSGLNVWQPDQRPDSPGFFNRPVWEQNKIINIAKGLLATSDAQLERPPAGGDAHAEQRAAFLVAQNPLVRAGRTHHRCRSARSRRVYPLFRSNLVHLEHVGAHGTRSRWPPQQPSNDSLDRRSPRLRHQHRRCRPLRDAGGLPAGSQERRSGYLGHVGFASLGRGLHRDLGTVRGSPNGSPAGASAPAARRCPGGGAGIDLSAL